MNINFIKKIVITMVSIISVFYAIFLTAPFIISPIANKYIPMVNDEIKKTTGLNTQFENFRIVTTPKFTVGASLGKLAILTPENKEIFEAENLSAKMSLLPLLVKKIEIDLVQVKSIDVKLGINKDGSFDLEKYFPAQTEPLKNEAQENKPVEPVNLPFELPVNLYDVPSTI
jgi:uncharacterized protein involved in outer membrane biogenesis